MKKTIFAVFLGITAFSFAAAAQQRDQEKEKAIEEQLKTIAPAYVDVFRQATAAMDKQEYRLADSLYTIVYEHAPAFDPVMRRLGSIKASSGKVNEGIALCEKAVEHDRSSANIIMLVSCLITPRDNNREVLYDDYQRALVLLQEGRDLPEADEFEYNMFIAQVAMQLNNIPSFRTAVEILVSNHSDQMVTHYYAAILAASDQNWETAEREIRIAHKMGLPKEDMDAFLASGVQTEIDAVESEEDMWATARLLLWIVLWWLCGFVALFVVGRLLSFYTLRSIERQVGNNELQSGNMLRRIYKILINSAGFYYYISLPIVLVVVLALAAVIVYTFILIGHIPIKIMIILIIGVGITVFGMLRSLFVKGDPTEPGRVLKQEEAPELYALVHEVATAMHTRPIDEIRITPHTDMAVYETGSWQAKLRDNGKRVLIIGTGVLKDFQVNAFRAVLAHEYGHFANRDTAGGGVAMRVQNDMANYYIALYNAGQAVWWNVGFLFLRFYHFIFRRISAGATRLQEVLADRVSAQTYGYQAFHDGLTFVIKKNIDFTILANNEIREAEMAKRPYSNLYELSGNPGPDAEKELKEALNRPTTEEDTHPSPVDRFRYIEGLQAEHPFSDTRSVNELFTNWNAITQEMTDQIRRIVALNKQHGH